MRILVTGLGAVSSLGLDAPTTWQRLCAGRSGVKRIALFDSSGYYSHEAAEIADLHALADCPLFARGLHTAARTQLSVENDASRATYCCRQSSPGPAGELRVFDGRTLLDRGSIMLRAACLEAISHAGIGDMIRRSPERVGLVTGATLGGMAHGTAFYRQFKTSGISRARLSLLKDYLLNDQVETAAGFLGLAGPAVTVTNACAAGTSALGVAALLIRAGKADAVLAGGYDPFCEFIFAGFSSLQAVARDKCRPFDRRRNGMVLGEGAGMLVLETSKLAAKRSAAPLAELKGVGESCDAFHMTRPAPDGKGAFKAISSALKSASVTPDSVEYINTHGTGTPSNDVSEALALKSAFGSALKRIPLSSTKPAVGHLLGGAGGIEAVFTVLALKNSLLPATLNHDELDPACGDLDVIHSVAREEKVDVAVSNSFGFGGQNAVAVFGRA
jgi:3-oxoacyl-[acyl-carrier-protein] synthase II